MSAVLTEEQEKVVKDARDSMSNFDSKAPLFRWLGNYAPSHNKWFWTSDWHVVTREGRHWKVEIGAVDSDKPRETLIVDGRAPVPPIMEHRPPKPKPVKQREVSPEPLRVPSALEYITMMMDYREREEFQSRMRELSRRRRPVMRSLVACSPWDDEIMPEPPSMSYENVPISERDMMALAHMIMERRLLRRAPPTPQPIRPPPLPTRRNQ